MDEEALARELAQLERQQRDAREPAWDDVANGRRSVDEVVAELRARGEDEAELSRMAELMAPLPGAFDDALAERLVESLEPAEVIAMPEREPVRWHRLGWAAAGLLAAAALVVVVVLPREPGPATDEPTPLPEHALSLRPGASELRAADDGPVSVAAGGTLRFSLRPATSYALEPHVWACAERGGTSRPLEVVLDPVVPGRVIEGRATIPADLALGEWTLLTVVDGQPPPAEPCAIEPGPGRRMPRVGFVVTPR
ncbi:MAG: hypothetical protein H6712_19075 [Myxococcales bacterium]|nr:hypothetical protein [Myxococcales bacterium]MCB9715978.1 hypothetical protein [Myxococcales bacterium]